MTKEYNTELLNDLPTINVAVKPAIQKAVDPSHYKGFVDKMQWIEVMQIQGRFGDSTGERFQGALELQVRKYMDRCGGKDDEAQELRKACFYLMAMIMDLEGKKLKAAHIHEVLKQL